MDSPSRWGMGRVSCAQGLEPKRDTGMREQVGPGERARYASKDMVTRVQKKENRDEGSLQGRHFTVTIPQIRKWVIIGSYFTQQQVGENARHIASNSCSPAAS